MNVLFVCTGNTCRSPIGEFILKNKKFKNMKVWSRGLSVNEASKISENSKKALSKFNISCDEFTPKNLTIEDLEKADIILTMTLSHKNAIESYYPQIANKVFTLKENGDIIDPFMQSEDIYIKTAMEINNEIERLCTSGVFKDS